MKCTMLVDQEGLLLLEPSFQPLEEVGEVGPLVLKEALVALEVLAAEAVAAIALLEVAVVAQDTMAVVEEEDTNLPVVRVVAVVEPMGELEELQNNQALQELLKLQIHFSLQEMAVQQGGPQETIIAVVEAEAVAVAPLADQEELDSIPAVAAEAEQKGDTEVEEGMMMEMGHQVEDTEEEAVEIATAVAAVAAVAATA